MATMFPARCESFATAGEEAVYRFLEKGARPDGDFLAWYSPDIEDREPDFILLSPDCGLVVLEVKDWLASQILELNPKEALLQIAGRPSAASSRWPRPGSTSTASCTFWATSQA